MTAAAKSVRGHGAHAVRQRAARVHVERRRLGPLPRAAVALGPPVVAGDQHGGIVQSSSGADLAKPAASAASRTLSSSSSSLARSLPVQPRYFLSRMMAATCSSVISTWATSPRGMSRPLVYCQLFLA